MPEAWGRGPFQGSELPLILCQLSKISKIFTSLLVSPVNCWLRHSPDYSAQLDMQTPEPLGAQHNADIGLDTKPQNTDAKGGAMNINKDHAIMLLAQGIATSQVAAAIGCDDSYISQLKADPEVQQKIAEMGATQTLADVNFDTTLERAESLALEKIEKNLPFATLGQAMAAFRVLNGARRRKDGVIPGANTGTTINVNLTLPAAALPRYITNAQSEIVEVEGKTMISATTKTIDQILAARAGNSANLPAVTALEKAASRLGSLAPLAPARARKSPLALSPDIL